MLSTTVHRVECNCKSRDVDQFFGHLKGSGFRKAAGRLYAYKEAMVRIQAGKERKVDWAVGDVVEGMILVVEGRTWRPDWLLDAV